MAGYIYTPRVAHWELSSREHLFAEQMLPAARTLVLTPRAERLGSQIFDMNPREFLGDRGVRR